MFHDDIKNIFFSKSAVRRLRINVKGEIDTFADKSIFLFRQILLTCCIRNEKKFLFFSKSKWAINAYLINHCYTPISHPLEFFFSTWFFAMSCLKNLPPHHITVAHSNFLPNELKIFELIVFWTKCALRKFSIEAIDKKSGSGGALPWSSTKYWEV